MRAFVNAAKVARPVVRPVFKQSCMPTRSFSSFEVIERSSQKLKKALDNEIKYENENYTQLEDIETFLNESGFSFKEVEADLSMVLSKDVGDKFIEI